MDSENFATFFNGKDVAVVFHRRAHTRVQVDLFAGGILCIDAWYTLFREVVRGCVYCRRVPPSSRCTWMWVLIRDQHVSARTRVYLAAEGALLSAHTCVCPAAGCKKECWRGSVVIVSHPLHAGCVGVRGPPVMASHPWEPPHILPRRSEVEWTPIARATACFYRHSKHRGSQTPPRHWGRNPKPPSRLS